MKSDAQKLAEVYSLDELYYLLDHSLLKGEVVVPELVHQNLSESLKILSASISLKKMAHLFGHSKAGIAEWQQRFFDENPPLA